MNIPNQELDVATAGLYSDITLAAEATYNHIFNRSQSIREMSDFDRVHTLSMCGMATKVLVEHLRADGHKAYIYDGTAKLDGDYFEHFYAVMRDRDRVVIADPTWAQFLPDEAVSENPKVLIGTRQDVAEYAETAGVDPLFKVLWDRHYRPEDTNVTFPNPGILRHGASISLL